jgi:uncharacterized protein YjbJ (UPF0337 family)
MAILSGSLIPALNLMRSASLRNPLIKIKRILCAKKPAVQVANWTKQVATAAIPDATGKFPVATGTVQVATGKFQDATGTFQVATGKFQDATGTFQVATGKFQDATGNVQDARSFAPITSPARRVARGPRGEVAPLYQTAERSRCAAGE